jgi:hypothetical protein
LSWMNTKEKWCHWNKIQNETTGAVRKAVQNKQISIIISLLSLFFSTFLSKHETETKKQTQRHSK